MKFKSINLIVLIMLTFNSCSNKETTSNMNIIFLHHSTGGVIWRGGKTPLFTRVVRRINTRLADKIGAKARLPLLFDEYNKKHSKNYLIKELAFPKITPYGWNNYPYDYYNIWVKNGGEVAFMEEPTLEMITKEFQIVIFKHCYPSSNIMEDKDSSDISSDQKTIGNYKLQYSALRDKLHEFPETKFILFTGAVQVKSKITEDEAKRANEFFKWVTDEWDLPDDNIYLWDLYSLQTEGGLYFRDDYAVSVNDSHPNDDFAKRVSNLLFNRIIDVVENNGKTTKLTGE